MFKFQPTTSEGLKAIIVSREGKDAATTFILPQLDKKELLKLFARMDQSPESISQRD